MYCRKCGNKVNDGNKFCTKCGFDLSQNNINKQNKKSNADGKAVASLIIGFISLFLSFTLSILLFPLELIGLILGITSKTSCSEKTAGIVINIVSMVISVLTFIALIVFIVIIGVFSTRVEDAKKPEIRETSSYTWNCKVYGENDYSITLSLNGDTSGYVWSKYDDAINNSIYGSYETNKLAEDEYTIKFISYSIISNGTLEQYEYESNFRLSFYDGDNFIMTSLDNASKYFCDIPN